LIHSQISRWLGKVNVKMTQDDSVWLRARHQDDSGNTCLIQGMEYQRVHSIDIIDQKCQDTPNPGPISKPAGVKKFQKPPNRSRWSGLLSTSQHHVWGTNCRSKIINYPRVFPPKLVIIYLWWSMLEQPCKMLGFVAPSRPIPTSLNDYGRLLNVEGTIDLLVCEFGAKVSVFFIRFLRLNLGVFEELPLESLEWGRKR
jgi:hypothetical protein